MDALPRFSPDGRSVVFSSQRTGRWQLYELELGAGEVRRLHESAHAEWQADVAPDGRGLVFVSEAEGASGLWLQALGAGGQRLLFRHGGRAQLGNPHWGPAGDRIVFSSSHGLPGHRIYVLDVGSGEARRISPLASGGCEPRFSRDGRRVVYVRRQHLTRDTSTIVEHDLASGADSTLVEWPGLNYDPVYSPDGSELAFVSTVAGEFALYRLRLSDGRSWRVSFGPGAVRHPDYQPAP